MEGADLPVPASVFASAGEKILRKSAVGSVFIADRRFRGLFGATPTVCSRIWALINCTVPAGGVPKHLLWALIFLKVYSTEHVHSALTNIDEKTFRKLFWTFVGLLSRLKVVRT